MKNTTGWTDGGGVWDHERPQRHGCANIGKYACHRVDALIKTAGDICRRHHERYDGNGYPDGLKGEEIPMEAQVVALAYMYDALTILAGIFPQQLESG